MTQRDREQAKCYTGDYNTRCRVTSRSTVRWQLPVMCLSWQPLFGVTGATSGYGLSDTCESLNGLPVDVLHLGCYESCRVLTAGPNWVVLG